MAGSLRFYVLVDDLIVLGKKGAPRVKGWTIFLHAARMVLGNWKEALQLALLPALLVVVVISSLGGVAILDPSFDPAQDSLALAFGQLIVNFVIMSLVICWVGVNWHRFVLLEEYPSSWIPPIRFKEMLSYIWKGLILIGVGILAMLPVQVVIGLLAALTGGASAVSLFILIAAVLVLSVGFYRLAVILPSAAIGQNLSLGKAWSDTKEASADILVVIVASFMVQVAIQLFVMMIGGISPVLGTGVSVFASIVLSLINISVLTALYGHYVEGRPLNGG